MPSEPAINQVAPDTPALKVPRHLGVTMDGNGRWARLRGKPRTEGHAEGIKALRRLVEYAGRYGIEYLTIFSFSSENWSRPAEEIRFIFGLLRRFVSTDLKDLMRNNVHVRIIGERDGLDRSLLDVIDEVEAKTADNTGLCLQVAFNYGGKGEIARAARVLARKVAEGEMAPDDITESAIENALFTAGIPDPDVILRTSGEHRFSNFLLWQAAYSELVFVDDYWPDFNEQTFLGVLEEYARRERRFGGVEAK